MWPLAAAEHKVDRPKLTSVLGDGEVLDGFSRLNVAMAISNPNTADNPLVYVNDAFERITGYPRSEVIGRNCRFLQGEATDLDAVERLRSAIEAGEDVCIDLLNYRASGEPFMNRLLIAPIADERGKPLYYLSIQKELRDDERDRTEEVARTHMEMLRSRVGKDLGLLIGTLSGSAALGNTVPKTEADRFQLLRLMQVLPRRLECLDFVYQEMQLTDAQWVRSGIDLGSLLSRISYTVAHNEGRPGIRFVSEVEPLEVNLETAIRVSLIAFELLSNAFQHAFDGMDQGFVELRVKRLAAGGLRMTVADDGVGLPGKENWPSDDTVGGRLVTSLLDGLDATINVARGAAGMVIMVDVPVGFTDIRN